ncbi:LysR family transcriptional regulator [Luteibacter sp. PPL552]
MHGSERLKGLDVFVAVVESGSFTAASERLNLTNSAVGKSVARLEQRLGVKLFERTTRRLALTNAGEAFHRTCLRVLMDLEDAEQAVKAEATMPVGRLRIDLPASYGKLRAMPALFEFMDRYPAVHPAVSFTDRFVDPVADAIDVTVRIGGSDTWPPAIGYRYLGHERKIFCCSPSYLAGKGAVPDTPESLHDLDALVYRRADGTLSPWFVSRDGGPAEHVFPVPRLAVGSAEALVDAVGRGLGVAQLSTWLIDDHLARGGLVPILPSFAVEGLPLYLLWLRRRQNLPKVSALLAHLADRLRI